MKFLKALGIGVATQLSVTILSVILLLAFCSVSPGGCKRNIKRRCYLVCIYMVLF